MVPKGTIYKIDTREFRTIKLGLLEFPLYDFDEMVIIGRGDKNEPASKQV